MSTTSSAVIMIGLGVFDHEQTQRLLSVEFAVQRVGADGTSSVAGSSQQQKADGDDDDDDDDELVAFIERMQRATLDHSPSSVDQRWAKQDALIDQLPLSSDPPSNNDFSLHGII
jgi:hypothetical protein